MFADDIYLSIKPPSTFHSQTNLQEFDKYSGVSWGVSHPTRIYVVYINQYYILYKYQLLSYVPKTVRNRAIKSKDDIRWLNVINQDLYVLRSRLDVWDSLHVPSFTKTKDSPSVVLSFRSRIHKIQTRSVSREERNDSIDCFQQGARVIYHGHFVFD